MSALVLDDCLQNLILAQEDMKEWIPMTEYEWIFEAVSDPVVAANAEKNEATMTKSSGHIKKAIDAVIGMIKKLASTVTDFIRRLTMKGDERAAFNSFKEQMKKDPTLKNKKITVKDFRKINAAYEEKLKEIDQEIRMVKANEKHPIDKIVKSITGFLGGTLKATGVIVGSDVAIKMAESNVTTAKVISQTLKLDESFMQELSKTLGEKDAMKYQKRVDAAAKNTILTRLKIKVLRRQYEDAQSCVDATISSLTHGGFMNPLTDMGRKFLQNEYTGKVIKTTGKTAVKGAVGAVKDEAKYAIDKKVDKILDPKQKRAKGTDEYKSAGEFFTGKKKK